MLKIRNSFFFTMIVTLLFSLTSLESFGQETKSQTIGGIVRSILSGEPTSKETTKSGSVNRAPIADKTPAAVTTSQLAGLFVMQSFLIYPPGGGVISSTNYQFIGDMAITSHNIAMQRIAITGFETTVGSGLISLSGNTYTFRDDLDGSVETGTLTWDGTYLTINNSDSSGTEIDTWKKVSSGESKTIVIPLF